MQVLDLDATWEERFLRFLRRAPLEHYWFLVDWTFDRPQSTFALAVGADGRIEGATVVFGRRVAQVRGTRPAVDALLAHMDLPQVDMTVPRDCKDLLCARYDAPVQSEMIFMHLDRGNEVIRKGVEPMALGATDAPEIVDLLHRASPDGPWDDMTIEQIVERMRTVRWLGIREGGVLASIGNARFTEFGSNIGIVATDAPFRNRGYATSIVSALVETIFRWGLKAVIHVLSDNSPAVRAYSSVGFRPYNVYFRVRNAVKRR